MEKTLFDLETLCALKGFILRTSQYIWIENKSIQFRKPRSRKKRINAKFSNDSSNYRCFDVHRAVVDTVNRIVYVNPKTLEQYRQEIQKNTI